MAKVFVLATGGVENARLLLVSSNVHKFGIGNGSDRVGRFFMEHPERTMAHVVITSRAVAEDIRFLRRRRAMLCLSEQTQRAHELLNANIEFGPETQLPESEAGGFPLALRAAIQRVDRIGLEEPVGSEPAGLPHTHDCGFALKHRRISRAESRSKTAAPMRLACVA